MRLFVGLYLLLVFSQPALAVEMQAFQPVERAIGPEDRIVIRGYKGDVSLTGVQGDTLKVEGLKPKSAENPYDQWNFTMKRVGNDVEIVVKGPSDSEDWAKVTAGKVPTFSLRVSGPPRKVFVAWQDGKINLKNWQEDATINTTKGSILTSGTKGALRAQALKGSIQISGHEGTMSLQAREGQVAVESSKGPVGISNHSASVRVSNHQGSIDLQNFKGGFTSIKNEGDIVFSNNSGAIVATGHSGSVRGESDKGSVSVKAKRLQDFNVTTGTGAVTLDLPSSAGAYVSIRSERGRLRGAPHFAKMRKGRWTELKGKLKGKEQGQVKIVSKYGNIVVK